MSVTVYQFREEFIQKLKSPFRLLSPSLSPHLLPSFPRKFFQKIFLAFHQGLYFQSFIFFHAAPTPLWLTFPLQESVSRFLLHVIYFLFRYLDFQSSTIYFSVTVASAPSQFPAFRYCLGNGKSLFKVVIGEKFRLFHVEFFKVFGFFFLIQIVISRLTEILHFVASLSLCQFFFFLFKRINTTV